MNFLFLMDPLESVNIHKDTTFALMGGAQRRQHNVYYLKKGGIALKSGHHNFHVTQVIPQTDTQEPFKRISDKILNQNEVDCIFIRSDPPFDYDYLIHTWLLDRLPKTVVVINRPDGIRTANEKIWVTQFTSLVPKTLISRNRKDLLWFVEEYERVVVKPTDGFGGHSVFSIQKNDPNTNVILETITHQFTREVILQEFIKEADQGDKRILVLNGEPLGAVLRVHAKGDHRNNFFSGGKPVKTSITDQERGIVAMLKPELIRLGLYFVGIDILGGYLIEVNVTSPTCLQEMNCFYNQKLEDHVIQFAEQLVSKKEK